MSILSITLNSAIDLVSKTSRLAVGEVNLIETIELLPAGKGINVAKVLHDLSLIYLQQQPNTNKSFKFAVSGFIGKDNHKIFSDYFFKHTWQNNFILVDGLTRTNIKITQQDGQVTDLNFQGYKINQQQWNEFKKLIAQISQDYTTLIISGSLPPGISIANFQQWLLELKQQGKKCVIDTSGAALQAAIATKPFLIKPNIDELEKYLSRKLENQQQMLEICKQLNDFGIDNVIISLGSKGAIWSCQQGTFFAQPNSVEKIISTVGAGDSMVAGLSFGLEQGLSIEETFRLATACSVMAVMQPNVGIFDQALWQQIQQQIIFKLL